MRTFFKPMTAVAGAGVLALSMSAPALAAPADPNGLSPSVTVTSATTPKEAFTTGAAIRILEGEDDTVRPSSQWNCGLLRMDGHIDSTPSKDNRYKASWKVSVGASYDLPSLTITMPGSSSHGLGWTIPDQTPTFGDEDSDVADLPATNTHPEYTYIDDSRVYVESGKGDDIVIKVPDGLDAGEYFNVEFDSELTDSKGPKVNSEYVNDLKVNEDCETPDLTQTTDEETRDLTQTTDEETRDLTERTEEVGGETEKEDCYEGRNRDDEPCVERERDEKCEEGMTTGPDGEPCVERVDDEKCEEGTGPDGERCDRWKDHPVKVNSGGENDSASGLIALALGAAVIGGAATYGIRRGKKA